MNVNTHKICLLDRAPHVQIQAAVVHRKSVPVVKCFKRMAVIQRVPLQTLRHLMHASRWLLLGGEAQKPHCMHGAH